MRFSILTPTYNAARFLPRALQSVHDQGGDVEHIVVDGGSRDGSKEILASFGSTTMDWVSERDDGQSDALNKALMMASGDVIGWLNADEYYLPGAIRTVETMFLRNPAVGVVYGEYYWTDCSGGRLRLVGGHRPSDFVLRQYGCHVPSCATFIRRDVLPDRPWDHSLRWIMDWDLWLKLRSRHVTFRYVPVALASFTVHPGQVTAGDRTARAHEWTEVRERYGIWPVHHRRVHHAAGRLVHVVMKAQSGAYWREYGVHRALRSSGAQGDLPWRMPSLGRQKGPAPR